jgi:hypothetical protein
MPMTFPAHQGLILPVVRRWPSSFDALALSVGAAMPDITDSILGFPINGYFKQWYGHALIGVFTLDLLVGLFITWLITAIARRLFRDAGVSQHLRTFFTQAKPRSERTGNKNKFPVHLWSFSLIVGILSHIGFDLISHDTNLFFYPWAENPRWFPGWWYKIWFEFRPLPMFGRTYSVGIFSVTWCLLTIVGIFSFIKFLRPIQKD